MKDSNTEEHVQREFKEIFRLKKMLDEEGIPYRFTESFGGWHIIYSDDEDDVCSVIEHKYSYGNAEDLLEIQGLLTEDELKLDSVAGYLSADDVFGRIKRDFYLKNPIEK